jgi:hypothetical protein
VNNRCAIPLPHVSILVLLWVHAHIGTPTEAVMRLIRIMGAHHKAGAWWSVVTDLEAG